MSYTDFTYSPTSWTNTTAITPDRMNNIENGIKKNQTNITDINSTNVANKADVDLANVTTGCTETALINDLKASTAVFGSALAQVFEAGELDATTIVVKNITAENITAGYLNGERLKQNSITTEKLNDAAVTLAKLADNSVATDKIQDKAVTDAKIVSLDAGKITTGYLDAARVEAGSLSADKLSIDKLEAISSTLGTVEAGVINSSEINGGSITGTTITGGSISGTTITGATINGTTINLIEDDPVTAINFYNGSTKYGEIKGVSTTSDDLQWDTVEISVPDAFITLNSIYTTITAPAADDNGQTYLEVGQTDMSLRSQSILLQGYSDITLTSDGTVSIYGCISDISLTAANGFFIAGTWAKVNHAGNYVHIHLDANKRSAPTGNIAVATIPEGYRPSSTIKVNGMEAMNKKPIEVQVHSDGQIVLWNNPGGDLYVYVDIIYYI